MKVTTGQIHNAMNALVTIGVRPGVRIPQMASFRLKKLYDKIEAQSKEIEKIQRELVIKHGREKFLDEPANTKPSGQFAVPDGPNRIAYDAEWEEFQKEEVDVDVKPISIELFGNGDHGIDLKELVMLGPFIEEPKE